MPGISGDAMDKLVEEISTGEKTGAVYYSQFPDVKKQSGSTCGMYALKWAIEYRSMKTGEKAELLPARARDVCANCGTELRIQNVDKFQWDTSALRDDPKAKKSYYCIACVNHPGKRKMVRTMRSIAKANGLSVMGELMEPVRLLELAQKSGFSGQAKLIDAGVLGAPFESCLLRSLDSGKMALLIFDVDLQTGDPGTNAGNSAHWCVVFGYYNAADGIHLLAVHGWAGYFNWLLADLVNSMRQMKVHPGWDLDVPVNKVGLLDQAFAQDAVPSGKTSHLRGGPAPPAVNPANKRVDVPGMDYTRVNQQFVEFG